jgi:hypothetical protein
MCKHLQPGILEEIVQFPGTLLESAAWDGCEFGLPIAI